MALVLPIFMIIVLGIFEIGRAMMVEQALSNGARLGARRAILPNKSKTEVEQLVKTFCQDSFNANVTVAISVDGNTGTARTSAQQGDLCEVSVTVPFSQVSFLPLPRWLNNAQLEQSCTMEHE